MNRKKGSTEAGGMVGVETGGSWGAEVRNRAGSTHTSSPLPCPTLQPGGGGARPYRRKNQTGLVAAKPIPEQMGQFPPIAAVNTNENCRGGEESSIQKQQLLWWRGPRAVQVPPLGLVGTDADGSWVPMAVAAMAESGRLPHTAPAPSTEGLPRAFLQSLRTLFDILDDRQRGYVHLREIESRWQGADARELPCGVLEGLRQVAPASGYLTFERFVAGLRTSLLNANVGPRDQARVAPRSGDQPSLQQRLMFVPADEPRTVLERKPLPPSARPAPAGPSGTSRNPELLCVPTEAAPSPEEPKRPLSKALERSPSADDGAAACKTLDIGKGEARQVPRPRGERRRHTITNGVDCGLLKQMKELEQEQEVLLQGLEMMARGREWYQQQLRRVQDRQRRLSQSRAGADFEPAGSPLSLGRLLPKVQEVARCLGELLTAACTGRAPPSSSLGPTSPSTPVWQQQTILMLKEQNRLLTQEVTDKSERITQLEQEKSALIKQLFEARARSQQDAGPLDSTFI